MVGLSLGKCGRILMTEHDNTCTVTCTDNDNVAQAEVERFERHRFVDVWLVGNKIRMTWNGKAYVGNKTSLEFTTPGPQEYKTQERRFR